jgi:hypothetical protein
MNSRTGRIVLLGVAMVVVFGSVVAGLLRIIPVPRRETDYLVIGTLATFASLAVLCIALLLSRQLFFGRDRDR